MGQAAVQLLDFIAPFNQFFTDHSDLIHGTRVITVHLLPHHGFHRCIDSADHQPDSVQHSKQKDKKRRSKLQRKLSGQNSASGHGHQTHHLPARNAGLLRRYGAPGILDVHDPEIILLYPLQNRPPVYFRQIGSADQNRFIGDQKDLVQRLESCRIQQINKVTVF